MSDFPVETARAQLRELITILGELRNAGPRDSRFKQWRQITLTLLQRLWPNEPSRAERFRRIPFSAPTSRSDRNATRQQFERGCREASTYLTGLALELGLVLEPLGEATTGDDAPAPSMEHDDVVDLPHADMAEGKDAAGEMSWSDEAPAEGPATPTESELAQARKPATGPRTRLKDMLGFTDQAPPDHTPTPASAGADPAPAPVAFVPLTPDPIKDATPPPARSEPPPPVRVKPPARKESLATEPLPAPSPGTDPGDARRDLAAEFVLDSVVLQSRPRSTRGPESASTEMSPAAREVMELAGQVEALGVPTRESAIVRAALIDLAHQMESPPIHWGALRDTVAFAMDHPDLARRLMPLVLPYLDLAA